jgi:hypothetical protein
MITRSQWWATLLLVLTFGAGAVAGGLATDEWRDRGRGPRPSEPPGRAGRSFSSFLTQRLGLDSTQRDSVRAILKRYEPAMRQAMEDMRPRLDSIRTRIHEDIMLVLTDSQRVEFQKVAPLWNQPPERRRSRDRDRDKEKANNEAR